MTRTGWPILLAIGCGGHKDATSSTTPFEHGGDDTLETADTAAPAPLPKLVSEIRFRAFVAYDSVQGLVVDPVIDGSSDYISAFIVDLYEAGWSDSDDQSYCQVAIQLAGTPLAPEAAVVGFYWGIDIPAGLEGKSAFSDCLDKGFDAEQFVDSDPVAEFGAYDWSLRFGGTMSQDLADWLTPDTPTTDFTLDWFAAGDWFTETGGYDDDPEDNYWYAYAMDASENVDFDTHVVASQMVDTFGYPVNAYYVFDQNVYWNVGTTSSTTP